MSGKDSNSIYPLSLVQEEIWLSQVACGSAPLFNIGGYLKINGPINPDIFIQAHQNAARQNDVFRMTLHRENTIPGVKFLDQAEPLTLKDFTKDRTPDKTAMEWWEKQFCKPFTLYDRLMSRYYLLKVSDNLYYYAVCRHHLTMDGFSFSLLGRCLADNYNALAKGTRIPGEKPLYTDFILSDREYKASAEFQQAKDYWKKKYTTLPPPIIPRRYAPKFDSIATPSAFSHIWLERDFYNLLIKFAKKYQANVFFLMAAVLYTYFLKITQTGEFVFSLPLLNRSTPEFKETMGPFVNVIPVRLSFGLDINIKTFFELLKTELLESFPFQRFPLGEINRVSGIQKTGRGQIFDVGLSYERFDYNADFNGTPFEVNTMHNGYDQTPLTLAIKEYQRDQDVKLEFYYNLSAFKPGEIFFLMQRVKHVLEQIVEHPDMLFKDLSVIPEKESQKLLIEFNRQANSSNTTEPCIDELFKSSIEKYPEKTAVQFKSDTITYSRLDDNASRLASHLKQLLPEPESLVGIFCDKSIEAVVAMLAVLKAGAAYVPLDPSYPPDRINFMIENSGLSVILTRKSQLGGLSYDGDLKIIAVDDFSYKSFKPVDNAVHEPSALAYVIYTSGTTGQPKGVMCTHGGLSNLVTAQNRIFDIHSTSRLLQFASFSFDASVSEIFTALCAGATLIMAPKEALMPGPQLLDVMEQQKITHVTLPPSALSVMEEKPLPELKTLVTAGEPCPAKLFRKWGKGRRFINAYGPTEATVCASAWICSHESTGYLPMGKPVDNTSLYVLDGDLKPVPLGVPGELYIGGRGVARGYLNRPELDRGKFINNPLNHFQGHTHLYRTGDMVRFLPDDKMEFLGRVDNQVKLRGYRIELQEVASVISLHPKVSEACAVVKQTPSGNRILAAYFSTANSSENEHPGEISAELRQHTRQKLPEYMIPAVFIHQQELPHTPNGKIDARRLEKMEMENRSAPPPQKPFTGIQKTIALLFCAITNMDNKTIGLHDDFFETGMDSLSAIKFISRLEKEFNRQVPFSTLMRNSTIHSLADLLSSLKEQGLLERPLLVPIQENGANPPFFCITAGYGDIMKLKTLSTHLGKNQPFFMLQPPEINDRPQTAEKLASQYAREIRDLIPNGPYRIGGYSAGGLVAYETAKQLQAENGKVELLALIGAPRTYSWLSGFFNRTIGTFIRRFLPDPDGFASETLKILFALFKDQGLQHQLAALERYRAFGYKGKIDYFQGKRAVARFIGTQRIWEKNAEGEFELHMVSGNHDNFLKEPHVKSLAHEISQCLRILNQEKGKKR